MSPGEEAAAVRRGAGLFHLAGRGLLGVGGGDRVRWLNGMVTNDVAALAPGPEGSGCYALLLNRQGRILADLHVLLRPEEIWLETAAEAVGRVAQTLARFVVADDVALSDRTGEVARLGLEGPASPRVLERACGRPLRLGPDACAELELAGGPALVAAFGWSGEAALQLLLPRAAEAAAREALLVAGRAEGLVLAGPEALEILRIEAGRPRLGAELEEDVLPAEARLEGAISTRKGCYTGQEVVERMRSRGQVGHLLVGLRPEGALPAAGAKLFAAGAAVGELTSACHSPRAGAIALGFVRRACASPGTELEAAGGARLRVAPLPFVAGGESGAPGA